MDRVPALAQHCASRQATRTRRRREGQLGERVSARKENSDLDCSLVSFHRVSPTECVASLGACGQPTGSGATGEQWPVDSKPIARSVAGDPSSSRAYDDDDSSTRAT